MSDIVERLKDPSSGSPRWMDTMDEAADEIERLRTRIAALQNDLLDALDVKNGNGPTALSTVVAERDLLRARVAELQGGPESDRRKTINANVQQLASTHAFTLGHLNVTGGRELECVLERYDARVKDIERLRAEIADMGDDVERLSLACAAEAVEADRLRARIAELEAAQAWRPIADLKPSISEYVLLSVQMMGARAIELGYRDPLGVVRTNHMGVCSYATHWMPLPAPPKEGT